MSQRRDSGTSARPPPPKKNPRGRPAFQASAADRRTVKAGRRAGLTVEQIAAALGITAPTLRRHFRAELGPKVTEFRPTPAQRRRVAAAAGGGMTQRDIALALGINPVTLKRHFSAELTVGALGKRVEVLEAMHKAAKSGNVSAQRAYLSTVLAGSAPPADAKRPPKPSAPGAIPKGKKERAAAAAEDAAAGTDWGDLLPPSGAVLQ